MDTNADLGRSPVEIAPGVFWVGKREAGGSFFSNPYLRVFRGPDEKGRPSEFNLLVDPGSSTDIAVVQTKVASVIGGLERLSALFINHQDPDVGSVAPLILSRFATRAAVLCSEDTWRLIVHLNLPRERYRPTEKFSRGIMLPTGQKLLPVPTPFCHFRGAVALYDPATRVLFSGDLFGGLTDPKATGLWADESDWAGMRAFHQLYMPSNAALARAISRIRKLDPEPEIIAPQHGRLLRGNVMAQFMDRLERLPVGLDLIEEQEDQSLLLAWTAVLERVVTVARGYMRREVDDRLAADDDLADMLDLSGKVPKPLSMGKWCVERAVLVLTQGQPYEVANPIKMEAVFASMEYGLPTPSVPIEAEEEHDENAVLPL